jgi:hypothetical protein
VKNEKRFFPPGALPQTPGFFKASAKKCLVEVEAAWYPDEKEKALKG